MRIIDIDPAMGTILENSDFISYDAVKQKEAVMAEATRAQDVDDEPASGEQAYEMHLSKVRRSLAKAAAAADANPKGGVRLTGMNRKDTMKFFASIPVISE